MLETNQDNKIKSFLLVGIFLLVVFVLAVAVWYSPVLFKGYSTHVFTTNTLMGRNVYLTGLYSAENDLNVFLAPSLVKEQGHISAYGNKLTSLIYGKVFKITGLPDENNIVLFSIIFHALTLLILTGVVLYLFKFKTAIIFSLVYIFLPFNWHQPYHLSTYELSLFFFALFFLFYFWGVKGGVLTEKIQKLSLGRGICLIISGSFLALAGLSKEAVLLIVPVLFIFLWVKKQRLQLFYIFLPFVVLFGVFWLPGISNNIYLQFFTTQVSEEIKSADFAFYGHIYPDPYTYHFKQEEYLEDYKEQLTDESVPLIERVGKAKVLQNMGIQKVGLIDRVKVGLLIIPRHVFRFISLEDVGGPFIFLLILLGLYSLRKKNKYLYQFFVYWILSAIFLMAFVVLAIRNHLMDFNWAIALLISLGILALCKIIIKYFDLKDKKALVVYLIILLAVLYNLVLVNHVSWSRAYDSSNYLIITAYSQEIKKLNILDQDVIAVDLHPSDLYYLNYATNKSVVMFTPKTVEDLLEENILNDIFKEFKVRYVLGYSDELTKAILKQADVVNVASNSLEPVVPEMSRNKGWLMNLIN
ncbi:MAG: hypothetical protein ISS82_05245 [Nanoarchaeota archaeon]|nr:hypothetical protein [Nanoarchaeota archaeon]